jgi:isocitrate dehydrogenase (NAD+)
MSPTVYRVTLIPGDGTGPELTKATRRVLEGTGVRFDWDIQEAGAAVHEREGTPLPSRVLESLRKNKVGLKGPITTPVGSGFRSVNVALRKELDLYACERPCKSYPGVRSRYEAIDLVIVRENTEDLYAGIEFHVGSPGMKALRELVLRETKREIREDAGVSIKPISVSGTERIVRHAFRYARANQRRSVTAVHKANIMKDTDGLFLETARRVATEFPEVAFQDRIVDNMCMQLVQVPEDYDVLVLPNLYGDILSDLAAGLVGGLGVAPGANIGESAALFEPTHGSAPKYAGKDKVNPLAMILSGMLMLRHLGERDAADRLERAIARVIREGKKVTYDMKPRRDDPTAVGTQAAADAVIEAMG